MCWVVGCVGVGVYFVVGWWVVGGKCKVGGGLGV